MFQVPAVLQILVKVQWVGEPAAGPQWFASQAPSLYCLVWPDSTRGGASYLSPEVAWSHEDLC